MADLVTLIEAKQWLQITKVTYDDLINVIIPKASQFVESFTKRVFTSGTYKQIYDGTGDYELEVDYWPITSITVLSMSLDKENKEYSDAITANEIMIQKGGIVEMFDTKFNKGRRNIYLEYVAGYATIPEDIKQVVLDLIYKKFMDIEKKRVGLSVKNVMSENVSYIFEDLNRENRKTLKGYEKRDHNKNGVDVTGWAAEA